MRRLKYFSPLAFFAVFGLSIFILIPEKASLAQTQGSVQVSIDSATSVQPSSGVDLNIRVNSSGSSKPSSLQWDINYNPSDISSISWGSNGPVIIAAGKTATCNAPSQGVFRCLILGFNTNTIDNGVLGAVRVQVSSSPSATSIPLTFSNLIASDASGNSMSISGTNGTITTTGGGNSNLEISCDPSATSIFAGKQMRWNARASGGDGPYSYEWSGSEGLEGNRASVSITYYNAGQKTASVKIVSGSKQSTAQCGTVTVNTPPITGWCGVRVSPLSTGNEYRLTWTAGIKSPISTTTKYVWSGSDGLESNRSSASKTYSTGGLKTGNVNITSGEQALSLSCNASMPAESSELGGKCKPTVSGMVVTWDASAFGGSGDYSYAWSGTDGFSTTSPKAGFRYLTQGPKNAAVTIRSGNETLTLACQAIVAETGDGEGSSGSGCFIATAAFGTEMEPEVQTLRTFRDRALIPNPVGNVLVETYYKISPPIADVIREHDSLKSVVRVGLKPIIIGLEALDYDK